MTITTHPLLTLLTLLLLATAASAGEQQPGNHPPVDGALLYQTHCASCHHPLADTDKPQRSGSRLRSAIDQLPVMNHLKFLSEVETDAIASAMMGISFDN